MGYLWRAVGQYGKMIDCRLIARRDAKAARAFLRRAMDNARFQIITISRGHTSGYQIIRTVKNNHIHQRSPAPRGEIEHLHRLFGLTA